MMDCSFSFNADVRLDHKEKKVNLYPVGAFLGHQKEDYVQSELRRLRERLRMESAKLRPPSQYVHLSDQAKEFLQFVFFSVNSMNHLYTMI